ncbi:MAG: DUF1801 domain-containing protein [Planctomycetota bacterium]
MAELKTKQNAASVEKFLDSIEEESRRDECKQLLTLMRKVTKHEPKMWGGSIVGFGSYQYKYDSGRSGEWFVTGFSPRKQNLTVYIMAGFGEPQLIKKLGKFKTGKCCLYLKKLADVDVPTLTKLIQKSVQVFSK